MGLIEIRERWMATWYALADEINGWRLRLSAVLSPPMYVYTLALPEVTIPPGESKWTELRIYKTLQVIDLIVVLRDADEGALLKTDITQMFCGDNNMLTGACAPVCCFQPDTQNRFMRFTWLEAGQTISMVFRSKHDKPVTLVPVMRARSYRR